MKIDIESNNEELRTLRKSSENFRAKEDDWDEQYQDFQSQIERLTSELDKYKSHNIDEIATLKSKLQEKVKIRFNLKIQVKNL